MSPKKRFPKSKSAKLWQSGSEPLHPLVEAYTVGDDYLIDQTLVPYDVRASLAHAGMLRRMGALSSKELRTLEKGLHKIETLSKQGAFPIAQSQEDSHTAIEQHLTKHYGEVGKKIHTGRSRNDQSLVMLRLFMREKLEEIDTETSRLIAALQKKAARAKASMPGYTHQQKAMPTSVKRWLGSFIDALKDARIILQATKKVIDQNPLGSASGFGISNFPLDRAYTTRTLDFAKTQENPMYCGLSRGYFEYLTLLALGNIMFVAEKFATDLMYFTMQEFGFFSLPTSFTTGSSIMPQKRNYDVLEIMRGNAKVFRAYERQVRDIIGSSGSGYHRDLQLTKKPFVEGVQLCESTLALLIEIVKHLTIHEDALKRAMTKDLFVTARVYELVRKGMNFRDAYRQVKQQLNS